MTADPKRQERARRYAAIKHRLYFIDLALGAFALVLWLATGASFRLAATLPGPWPLSLALHLLVVGVVYTLLSAPLSYYSGHVLPHRYGLSIQSRGSWILDQLKSGVLGLVFGVLILEAVYLLLTVWPDWWWLGAAAVTLAFTVGLAAIAPVLILPLFYRVRPLGDAELRERLLDLAHRSGTRVEGVYEMNLSEKSTAANAMLMGLGGTRRIVLTDTLLTGYSPDEIEVVLAHELAHHVHRDIWKGVVVSTLVIVAGFWLAGALLNVAVIWPGLNSVSDTAGLPIVLGALALVAVLFGPVTNAFSRVWEASADRYALAATRNPAAFRSMLLKLADQNLAELEPSRLVEIVFYDHPSIAKRLRLADESNRS